MASAQCKKTDHSMDIHNPRGNTQCSLMSELQSQQEREMTITWGKWIKLQTQTARYYAKIEFSCKTSLIYFCPIQYNKKPSIHDRREIV